MEYWREFDHYDESPLREAKPYSQLLNYHPGDIVIFSDCLYECMEHNGMDYADIRIPGINAWVPVETSIWEPNLEYEEWAVVEWEGQFYVLLTAEDIDLTVNPHESDNWGLIGDYVTDYAYELKETEYVVFDVRVW